jgi:5-methylcytosine-specific restriction protein A
MKKLEVHHIVPFHINPSLELDMTNLVTLCECKEDGINCHLFVGHLGNYRSYNPEVRVDAKTLSDKLRNRPAVTQSKESIYDDAEVPTKTEEVF